MAPRILLTLLGAAALYVAAAEYTVLRSLPSPAGTTDLNRVALWLPWGGYAWREAADDLGRTATDQAFADRSLARSAIRYPLDAGLWLDRASIALRDGGDVSAHLAAAVAVDPRDRDVLWDAAMLAVQAEDMALAETHLKQWARVAPAHQAERALFVASRWIEEPGALVERVLPNGRDYLEAAMRFARETGDVALAEAVWSRWDATPDTGHALLLAYVELLLDAGDAERAAKVWASADDTYQPFGVPNGGFSREPGEPRGMNWLVHPSDSVSVARDTETFHEAPAALRVAFNGEDNVHLAHPSVRLPVQPGKTYRLSGTWRAEELTTRSLPYLQVYAEGGGMTETVAVPGDSFEWTPWEMFVTVPDDASVLRLRLRRDRTRAFDRYIDGTLWLDSVSMETLTPNYMPGQPQERS